MAWQNHSSPRVPWRYYAGDSPSFFHTPPASRAEQGHHFFFIAQVSHEPDRLWQTAHESGCRDDLVGDGPRWLLIQVDDFQSVESLKFSFANLLDPLHRPQGAL